jgi:D-serine deaminase-like pyridoxal phosphate-dependent protein
VEEAQRQLAENAAAAAAAAAEREALQVPPPPVRSFSTHGQLSAAKGSSTTLSRSDIRLMRHLDSSALGLVRRWRLIGYSLSTYYTPPHVHPTPTAQTTGMILGQHILET